MDIFIIRDGRVAAYLRDSHLDAGLPILPMNVEIVQLTWAAPDDLVSGMLGMSISYTNEIDGICISYQLDFIMV